jgi:hypothetical protein
MPNTCRLVWNKNYMLSEISVKVFRSKFKSFFCICCIVTCAGLFNPGRAPFINLMGHEARHFFEALIQVISLRLGFRRNFLSVLHPNLVSSPIKGILEILNLTTRCICKHIFYGLLIGFNKIFITKLQNFKPCIWDF